MKGVTVALLLLVVLAASVFSQVPDEKLIVPGQRIGKWTLEMTIGDLVRMNGSQNSWAGVPGFQPISRMAIFERDTQEDIWWHLWANLQFSAATRGRDGPLAFIFIFSDEYKTAKGIAPLAAPRGFAEEALEPSLAAREAVEAAYGKPTVVTSLTGRPGAVRLIYDEIGLAVTVGRGGYVGDQVTVFRPGTAKTLWKF